MPTAKLQPSGMWKVRAYSHTDADGKQHYRSFTAPTKAEAEQAAARFSGNSDRIARCDLTVAEAIEGYITSRDGVLSPSTILGYRRMQSIRFDQIARKKIQRLTSDDVQLFISELSRKLSAKTVHNIYGLLCASVAHYAPEKSFRVKLPTKHKKRSHAASDAQIMALFDAACPELQKCIALGAFTSMRRGEICALRFGDIQGNSIHVHADMVKGPDGWIYKSIPKTSDSDRIVPVPPEVIDLLGDGLPDQYVIDWKPDTVTKRFIDLRNELGLPDIRFHDLRHYYASIAAVLVPSLYAESFGGWKKGSRTMREVYQERIDPLEQKYAQDMREYFGKLLKT